MYRRVHQDLKEVVAFLTTRVKELGKDYYKKLVRVKKYIQDNSNLALTL